MTELGFEPGLSDSRVYDFNHDALNTGGYLLHTGWSGSDSQKKVR